VLAYESLQIPVLAAGNIQQSTVWAGRDFVYSLLDQPKEVRHPLFEALAQQGPGLLSAVWVAQESREGCEKAAACDHLA
jgi:hypothetical protein